MLTVSTAEVTRVNAPAISSSAAAELDEPDEDGQGVGGSEPELREERGGTRQAAAAPQAEQFLRAMCREDHPDRQPEYGRTKQRHMPSEARGRRPAQAVYCVTLPRREIQYPRHVPGLFP